MREGSPAGRRARGAWLAAAVLSAWALACGAMAAAAQESPDSALALQPVVVRVMRGSVGTGSPQPISVVAGGELTRATGGAFLEEALRAVPGLQIQNRYNLASAERLAVRGFGARTQFGVRGVRVLVDGIPATLPDGQTALDHLDLSGLGRVELLRGPGSALYGNAAGGVLHFESLAPSTRDARLEVHSAGGTHGLRTWQGTVSGTIGEVGYRASVSDFSFDGFRRDPVADDGSVFGRSDRTILNATVQVPLARGTLKVVANGLDMEAGNPGSLSGALQEERHRQAFRFNVLQNTREDIEQGQLGVTWAGPFGDLDTELSAWGIRRDFLGAIPSDVIGFDRNAGGVRALFRGSEDTGAGLVSLGGGFEFEIQSDDRKNWENDGGERAALTLDQDELVRGIGLFVQGRLDVTPRAGLLTGLRYDRFHFDADDRFFSDDADDSGDRTMDRVSPSVGAVVRPLPSSWPEIELFGSVATSFETPTTTELANRPDGAGGFNPGLDPTTATTVEGGLRGRVGSAWSFEATFFHTELEDELISFEVPTSPGRSFFRNAGESEHTGWEMTVEGRPAPRISFRTSLTRVNGRFEAFEVDGEDFSGKRIPGVAPYRLDARALYEVGPGFVEARGLYQDGVPVDDGNTVESPPYFLADLRGGLREYAFAGFELSPWIAIQNVFDRRYNASVVVNAFGDRFFEPGPGRTYRVGASVTWGVR